MITQAVTVTERNTQNIIIGRRGTYDTEQVVFDVSYLANAYGDGVAVLMVKRPVDDTAYPATTTQEGNAVTWVITATDTSYKGHGECELFWYVDEALAKSVIYTIAVLRDIGETTEEAPDPYETWVDTLTDLGAETLQNAQAAETAQGLAEDAQTAAETAQGLAEDAQQAAESIAEELSGYTDQIQQNTEDIEAIKNAMSSGTYYFYDDGNGNITIEAHIQ